NTCPTGIATHDPKFKAKYKGNKDHIVDTLTYLAEDVRRELAKIGKESLQEIMGNTKLLSINDVHEPLINKLGLDLSFFTSASVYNKTENKKSL
ncbi:MAG TPA: hypothetical protein DHV30_00125, partial [Balneola sp.]|nr:hypothetical protein [Balneola sp.]